MILISTNILCIYRKLDKNTEVKVFLSIFCVEMTLIFVFFQLFIPRVIVMYCLGMLAFAFYITKFPERFIPGKKAFHIRTVLYSHCYKT